MIDRVIKRKPFEFYDIFLYSFIILLVLALFLFCLPAKNQAKGFLIYCDNQLVFSYDYSKGEYTVLDGYENKIKVDENNCKITIYFDSENDYNEISFDSKAQSVWVSESTCSNTKECVRIPKIKGESGSIYCAPHKLKIVAKSSKNNNTLVSGA